MFWRPNILYYIAIVTLFLAIVLLAGCGPQGNANLDPELFVKFQDVELNTRFADETTGYQVDIEATSQLQLFGIPTEITTRYTALDLEKEEPVHCLLLIISIEAVGQFDYLAIGDPSICPSAPEPDT